jgi:hypothetical protein
MKTYKYSELKNVLRVGMRVKEVEGKKNRCSELTDGKTGIIKSTKHSDGKDCFGGGWFIVMAELPSGQISNHYEMKDWNLFQCEIRKLADKYDGHTPYDVLHRLYEEAIRKENK